MKHDGGRKRNKQYAYRAYSGLDEIRVESMSLAAELDGSVGVTSSGCTITWQKSGRRRHAYPSFGGSQNPRQSLRLKLDTPKARAATEASRTYRNNRRAGALRNAAMSQRPSIECTH